MPNVGSEFRGLPIEELIAAPLKAACDAQKHLAVSAFAFMKEIGFDGDKPRLLEFNLQRPLGDQGGVSNVKVQAPFIGLVPIPSLLVNDVQIDFQMEVTDTATSKETDSKSVDADVNANFKFGLFGSGGIKIHGNVTSTRENTRSTNQTAKYQVRVSARQQQPTEGLSRLMDIMASCITPIPVSGSGG